jgi:predicted MFS family arabinose efflux permease
MNNRSGMSRRHVWGAVLAMALCAFALVASEFMPVSLLTPIAHELRLTDGQAGEAISVSGIFAVVTSLSIASVAARFDRKAILLFLTALMIASGFLVAFAPNYASLMVGRAMLGVSIGGYWSMSTAVMMRFVPEAFVPRAIAIMQGGSALATAVAAPMGSFLGGLVGWRGAFFCVVPLAAIALCWQALTLPAMPAMPAMPGEHTPKTGRSVFHLFSNRQVAFGMVAVALLFTGEFALFTYLRPFLETVTRVNVATLSLLLLAIGVTGLVGTMVVGSVLVRSLYAVLITIPLLMGGIAVSLVVFGTSLSVTAMLLGAWGLLATSIPVGWFMWLSKTLPEDAEAGGGLMVAVIQFAITIGATVGGIFFDGTGYRATFLVSAILLVLAALIAGVVWRVNQSASNFDGSLLRRSREIAESAQIRNDALSVRGRPR